MRMGMIGVLCLAAVVSSACAADISLPSPTKTGGMPLFQAIDQRQSAPGSNFPKGAIDADSLATILWAATGQNRDGSRWTVPMGLGKPPYCTVYYINDSGSYRYDWKTNTLVHIKSGDFRASVASQDFGKTAPGIIIIAPNPDDLAALPNERFRSEFALVLAGAMSQNIYLACEGVNVGTRLVYSIERAAAADCLGLQNPNDALFAMYVGKR